VLPDGSHGASQGHKEIEMKGLLHILRLMGATATLAAGIAVSAGALAAEPAEAAVSYTYCEPLKMSFSAMADYRRCYFEGTIYDLSWGGWDFTRGYDIQSCSVGSGCYSIAGGFARDWYASGNQWVFWRCRSYNGSYWQVSSC
jgi:hypothetical protein